MKTYKISFDPSYYTDDDLQFVTDEFFGNEGYSDQDLISIYGLDLNQSVMVDNGHQEITRIQ